MEDLPESSPVGLGRPDVGLQRRCLRHLHGQYRILEVESMLDWLEQTRTLRVFSFPFRLVAIYGFAMCLTVIIFGAAIGNWIDR